MVASLPAERKKEILRQSKEEQLRKIAMLAMQYERTIADMAQQQTVILVGCVELDIHDGCFFSQLKLDGAQMAEQNALRKQLSQEQELLQRFQESQEEKLKAQHSREKAALDVKVEDSRKELNKVVSLPISRLSDYIMIGHYMKGALNSVSTTQWNGLPNFYLRGGWGAQF